MVDNNLPAGIGSYRLFWAPLWITSILFLNFQIFLKREIQFFLLYGIFLLLTFNSLYSNFLDWDVWMIQKEYFAILISLTILLYFRTRRDYIGYAIVIKWALIFIGIMAVMSIISSVIDPFYARNLISGKEDFNKDFFSVLGGGGYSHASLLVAILPMVVYYYKNSQLVKWSKFTIIAFGALCFFALIRMQIVANIIISLIAIVIAIFGTKNLRKSVLLITLLISLALLLPKSVYVNMLNSVAAKFDQTSEVAFKFKEMSNYLVGNEVNSQGINNRASRYPLLIEAFIENPIFGYYANYSDDKLAEGGHLYWMNRLTIFGIIGFVPYLFVHIMYIKRSLKYFNKEYTFYFLISVFSIIVLGLIKHLGGRPLWFTYFIIIPGLYYLPLLNKRVKNDSN